MQVGDAVSGVFFILFACLVFWLTKDFRVMPGQNYGASFFPRTIAVCMGLMGLFLLLRGLRQQGAFRVSPGDWVRSGGHVINFLLVIAVLVFYILASGTLGFLISGFLSLFVLLMWLRGPAHWIQAVVVSVVCVLGMQLFFGEFLRVPLPWGLLQPVAWQVMEHFATALPLVLDPYVLTVILLSGMFGLFMGAIPGLSATMATALLVPVTFFMPPVPALAAIVTTTAMAIFAGDLPGALLRIPGTPASAAYTDEAFALTRKGKAELALGTGLASAVVGGLFGTLVLVFAAPILVQVAKNFSSFEYFWLACLGLTCAAFIAGSDPVKGAVSLLIGLLIATVGLDPMSGQARFTFGSVELMGGVNFIPAMIGMFALAEVLRVVTTTTPPPDVPQARIGNVFSGLGGVLVKYRTNLLRGSVIGTFVGALPGAGSDIAAWISYAVSKKFSREPEKFGTGHPEGLVDAGASNNAALGGTWVPALVFGIPGDSITAIVIGVLYVKGMNPGPTVFLNQPELIYAIFITFFLANLLLLPLGFLAIRGSRQLLRIHRLVLMPVILMFCMVGTFAINNSVFGIGILLVLGLVAFLMEDNGFPVAPAILGLVLGPLLEDAFMTSMIKGDGNLLAFFERPIAAGLGIVTILIWFSPLIMRALGRRRAQLPEQGVPISTAPPGGDAGLLLSWHRNCAVTQV